MRNGLTPHKSPNWRNFSLSVHSNIYKRKEIKSIFGTKPKPIATDSPSKILNAGIAEASKKLQELSDRAKQVKTTVPKRNGNTYS
jgi:hypothetical protein